MVFGLHLSLFFTPLFCLLLLSPFFSLHWGLFLFIFLTEDEKKPTHVFCLQLPPIPHFSLTPFCTATHILRTGLYIVFEKISECLCLHLLLNKCVGLLPAYLCVWMSTMTTIVCVSGRAQIHSLYACDIEWESTCSFCACTSECMFAYLHICVSLFPCMLLCMCSCVCVCTQ